LEPIHLALTKLLNSFPYDATFDQLRVLEKFRLQYSGRQLFSYDLSAATDRLPVDFQVLILTSLVNKGFAESWKRILVDRPYKLRTIGNDGEKINRDIFYAVGQPMGALSS